MLKDLVVKALADIKNGVFFTILYFTELPLNATAKKNGVVAIKCVEMVCRKGLAYSNQGYIKNLQAKLGLELTHKLSHGEWDEENEGIINFTDKNGVEKPKARVYMTTCIKDNVNKPINRSKVVYKVNGQVVDYNTLKAMDILQPNFFKQKENTTPAKLARLEELETMFETNENSLTDEEKLELLKLSKWAYNKCLEINCEHILSIG